MILLTGHWDHGGNLIVTTSDVVSPTSDSDEEDGLGTMGWAAGFDVATHKEAVQLAYDEYVRHEETDLIDKVEGFSIRTEVSA